MFVRGNLLEDLKRDTRDGTLLVMRSALSITTSQPFFAYLLLLSCQVENPASEALLKAGAFFLLSPQLQDC